MGKACCVDGVGPFNVPSSSAKGNLANPTLRTVSVNIECSAWEKEENKTESVCFELMKFCIYIPCVGSVRLSISYVCPAYMVFLNIFD